MAVGRSECFTTSGPQQLKRDRASFLENPLPSPSSPAPSLAPPLSARLRRRPRGGTAPRRGWESRAARSSPSFAPEVRADRRKQPALRTAIGRLLAGDSRGNSSAEGDPVTKTFGKRAWPECPPLRETLR